MRPFAPAFLAPALLALGLACAIARPAFPASPQDKADVVRAAIENHIRPAYAAFHASTGALAAAVTELCAKPGGPSLAQARDAFAGAVKAWSFIEFVQFGPVREDNRLEKILFYPDRRGIGLRQIQALLAKPDPAELAGNGMAGKSAALQGLPALEFLLHGTGAEALAEPGEGGWRCQVGRAIAANLDANAGALVTGWGIDGEIVRLLTHPGGANPLFANKDEALAAILKVLPNGYELIAETRLAPFLGEDAGQAKAKAAIWWRSGLTADALRQNVLGLQALAEASGALDQLAGVSAYAATNLPFETGAALGYLDRLEQPAPQAAATEQGHTLLSLVQTGARNLREVATTGILGGFGLAAGFSSLDGD